MAWTASSVALLCPIATASAICCTNVARFSSGFGGGGCDFELCEENEERELLTLMQTDPGSASSSSSSMVTCWTALRLPDPEAPSLVVAVDENPPRRNVSALMYGSVTFSSVRFTANDFEFVRVFSSARRTVWTTTRSSIFRSCEQTNK